jgi:UDP-N-acetylmuramyl pentapeptide synthase
MTLHPKTIGKQFLCRMLEKQVVELRQKYGFTVIAVAGSVGKTSTKLAIAHTLARTKRVIYQEGNYNDRLTVPLVLFGHKLPGLFNLPAWIRILAANKRILKQDYPYDVAVLELGTDGPGQMKDFAYLRPDLTVVTAITPEHMEFFKTLDAVASEELTVLDYSRQTLVNADDTLAQYVMDRRVQTYGKAKGTDWHIASWDSKGLGGVNIKLEHGDDKYDFASPLLGLQGAKITGATAAACLLTGLEAADVQSGLAGLPPTPGRMQILPGLQGSTIIDDTYNASPVAVMAGLDVLADAPAEKRIAILGSMNELGDYSKKAHEEVGNYCDAAKVDLVVTIGKMARDMLAPVAAQKGCVVESFLSPYEAGRYVKEQLKDGTVVLGEGSQNGVFAEEALKQLLADPADAVKFVRQSPSWLAVKKRQFPQQ